MVAGRILATLGQRSPDRSGSPLWRRRFVLGGSVVAVGVVAAAAALAYGPWTAPTPSPTPSAVTSAPSAIASSSASTAPSQTPGPLQVVFPSVRLGPGICANIEQGWAVDIPAGWWYSAAIDPCLYLDPGSFEPRTADHSPLTAIRLLMTPDGIRIFDTIKSREELTIAGHPAVRWEESDTASPENPLGGLVYKYAVQLAADTDSGPYFVATASSAVATDYPAAKATLDTIMQTWRQLENQLVARLDFLGEIPGFAPNVDVTLTGDGRIVWRNYEGNQLLVRQITPAGLALVRDRLQATGLFGADATYQKEPLAGVTPPGRGEGAWSFTVRNYAGIVVHVVSAAIDGDEADYWVITRERKALGELYQHLLRPESWLPPGAWAEPSSHPYEPDLMTLTLYTNPGGGVVGGHDVAEFGWMLADPLSFGESRDDPNIHKLGTIRCGLLPAQDAAVVVAQLRASGQLQEYPGEVGAQLNWSSGDGSIYVDLMAVRPDGSLQCNEVSG
jgi:hypothetical protein